MLDSLREALDFDSSLYTHPVSVFVSPVQRSAFLVQPKKIRDLINNDFPPTILTAAAQMF